MGGSRAPARWGLRPPNPARGGGAVLILTAGAARAEEGTPRVRAEASCARAEAAARELGFAEALEAVRADDRDPTPPRSCARVARARADDLAAHAEGGFAPLRELSTFRRDPQKAADRAAIEGLERDLPAFPPGPVRAEAWLLVGEAWARRLGDPGRAIAAFEGTIADPEADGMTREMAISELWALCPGARRHRAGARGGGRRPDARAQADRRRPPRRAARADPDRVHRRAGSARGDRRGCDRPPRARGARRARPALAPPPAAGRGVRALPGRGGRRPRADPRRRGRAPLPLDGPRRARPHRRCPRAAARCPCGAPRRGAPGRRPAPSGWWRRASSRSSAPTRATWQGSAFDLEARGTRHSPAPRREPGTPRSSRTPRCGGRARAVPEPNPALLIWSDRSPFLWRAAIALYLGGAPALPPVATRSPGALPARRGAGDARPGGRRPWRRSSSREPSCREPRRPALSGESCTGSWPGERRPPSSWRPGSSPGARAGRAAAAGGGRGGPSPPAPPGSGSPSTIPTAPACASASSSRRRGSAGSSNRSSTPPSPPSSSLSARWR